MATPGTATDQLCTVIGSCEAVCPKGISLNFIAKLNRDYLVATLKTG